MAWQRGARPRPGATRKARWAVLIPYAAAWVGCTHPEPPEALVELRHMTTSQALTVGREAAPDLVAEAERSLQRAEEALSSRDGARARWMATLGIIQARIAVAVARQQAAEARSVAASRALSEVEEDLARYESMRDDTLREIQRLESMRGESAHPMESGSDPDDGS